MTWTSWSAVMGLAPTAALVFKRLQHREAITRPEFVVRGDGLPVAPSLVLKSRIPVVRRVYCAPWREASSSATVALVISSATPHLFGIIVWLWRTSSPEAGMLRDCASLVVTCLRGRFCLRRMEQAQWALASSAVRRQDRTPK